MFSSCVYGVSQSEILMCVFVFRSSQEFISARTLQDKLRHDAVLHNLPNLKEKRIEKKYKQMETALSKLATVSIKSD